MEITISHKDIEKLVHDHFKHALYTLDYQDLIIQVLDRIDDWGTTDEEDLYQTIDDTIIWDEQMWEILSTWCRPDAPNWESAYECFCADCKEVWDCLKK